MKMISLKQRREILATMAKKDTLEIMVNELSQISRNSTNRLLFPGLFSNRLRGPAMQQGWLLRGNFPGNKSSICNSRWERWGHLGLRASYPWHIVSSGGPLHKQEAWYVKDQKNWASGTVAASAAGMPVSEVNAKAKAQQPVIYRGPLSDTLRKVKLLSLTSCCLAVVMGPAITFLTAPHLSVILKGGIAATTIVLSASTTAALHWFVGPYVHKLTWVPGSKEVEVELMTWMSTYVRETIQVEDIRPPKANNRPFVSFMAKGKFYFVDPDRISNKDLLRLVSFYQKKKIE